MPYFVPGFQCTGAPLLEERHHPDCLGVGQGDAGQPREQLLQLHATVLCPVRNKAAVNSLTVRLNDDTSKVLNLYLCQFRFSVSCHCLWLVRYHWVLPGGWQRLPSQPRHSLPQLKEKDLHICFCAINMILNSGLGGLAVPGSVFCFLALFFFLPLGGLGAATS